MKRFLEITKKLLPVFLAFLFLFWAFRPYYKFGGIILGGEGSYFLDFQTLLNNYGYSWYNVATGIFSTSLNFGYPFHLIFLQSLIQKEEIVNFVNVFLIYFLPFLAIYLLSIELKIKSPLAFLISLFYITNPFMSVFLGTINQWNMLAAYILPSFFLIIIKFYNRPWWLFPLFGLNSFVFSFTNANPPTMILYQIAIVLFVIIISLYKEEKLQLKSMIKNYFFIILSFFLFNVWWIANWFYITFYAQTGYSKEFAISWLRGSEKFVPAFWKTLNLTNLLLYPIRPQYDYFDKHYSYPYTPLVLSIPTIIVLYFLFKKNLGKNYHLTVGLALVFIGFLAKGVNGLFGGVYEFMVMNIPLFSIFKSAAEKWGLLFIFILTLYLIFILKEIKKEKLYSLIIALLVVYVGYTSLPFIISNFLPDYKFNESIVGSKKFRDKDEYRNLRQELNNDPQQYRVLSLPGSANYQVALQIGGNKFYTGNDPVLNNTNKPFIAPYNGTFTDRFSVLFDSISKSNYLNLLGLFNIKKIVINKDMYPWFGFAENESIAEMENIFDKTLKSSKNKIIDLYDVGSYYLPRFYVPQQVIYSPDNDQGDLATIISTNDFSKRSAIFIKSNSKDKKINETESSFIGGKSSEIFLIGDIQSAIDETRLRAGVKEVNQGGVLFPYVRWKPGGLFYSYIQKKERATKEAVGNDSKASLDQHLLFAAKRISEIQKWGADLDDEQFIEVLDRYKEEMQGAIADLDTISLKEEETFPTLLKIEVSFGAHEKRLTDVLKGYYPDEQNDRTRKAELILKEINTQLSSVVMKYYLPIKYQFNVPESGDYEILAERSKISPDWKIKNFKLDNSFIASASADKNDTDKWVSFGRRQFDEGQPLLTFVQPQSQNLLNNKDWKKLGSDVALGESVHLLGQNTYFGVYQDIKNWQPETIYKFSIKYKGGPAQAILIENENDKTEKTWIERGIDEDIFKNSNILINKSIDKSVNGDEWQSLPVVTKSGKHASSAKLFIVSRTFVLNEIADFEFKEANLEAVIEPEMALRRLRNEAENNVPEVTFTKINPTKYLINVEDARTPYFLIFSESFHQGWKAYIDQSQSLKPKAQIGDEGIVASYFNGEIKEGMPENTFLDKSTFETWGKKSIPEDRHITMNGYANAWYITPQDSDGQNNYQIIVEYWPQRLFYTGASISVLVLVVTLLAIVARSVKLHRRLK